MTAHTISNDEYHHGETWRDLIGSTTFKPFYTSPAAYRWPLPRDGGTFDLGTEVHRQVLTPDSTDWPIVLPEIGYRSAYDKDAWYRFASSVGADVQGTERKEELLEKIRGCGDIISADQMNEARAMAVSVRECCAATDVLAGGDNEKSFKAGWRKARPDCLNAGMLIDLKTTSKFDNFQWQMRSLRYPESLAWYESVLSENGIAINYWLWIVVDTKPYRLAQDEGPRHRVRVLSASEELQGFARERMGKALALHAECKARDVWPGEDSVIEEVD